MECFVTFLVLLVAFLFVTGSAARAHSLRSRRRRAYQQLARRFAGTVLSGGIFGRPRVKLRYGETTAIVGEAAGRGPYHSRCTQIVMEWIDPRFRCEVFPHNTSRLAALRGVERVALDDDLFNRHLQLHGRDENEVREFFCEGVRWQIEKLRALFNDGSLYVLIQHGRILVQKPHVLLRLDHLLSFVETSFELYDQAMLTRASGIEFMAHDEAQPLENVICKVCGDEINGDMIFCRRCKTPHHADCWHFNGACSVYGCGETVYLTPQPAGAERQPHTDHDGSDRVCQ
ncbi:MAG: RING finger protein [Pirellulaceae bacterium]